MNKIIFRLICLTITGLTLFPLIGCSEVADTGSAVSIPRVKVSCQTANCMTNATPRITLSITASGCTARTFDERASKTTTGISCTGLIGCSGESSDSWVNKNGTPTATIAAGTYSLCACINYSQSSVPWTSCDTTGVKDNVTISGTTGLVTITNWTD